MRPKVVWLSLGTNLPIKQQSLLSRKFDVTYLGIGDRWSMFKTAWDLRGHDVIVCQNTKLALFASVVSSNTPIIVENHGDLDLTNQTIAYWMVHRAWALRSVSQYTARQFDRFFVEGNDWKYHRSFPAWTDEDLFWEAGGIYKKSALKYALYCGGSYEHKGHKTICKVGYEVPVTQVTGLTQLELAREMAKANVVVVPSEREGLGLVALEAMMAGTPVIASDVGGLREIVKHGITGIRVDVGDVSGIVEAVKRLERDQALYDLIVVNAKEFVYKYWTKDRYLDGYDSLIREVLR